MIVLFSKRVRKPENWGKKQLGRGSTEFGRNWLHQDCVAKEPVPLKTSLRFSEKQGQGDSHTV